MDRASKALFSLQPVKFRYKKELDVQGIPQFGLVAEQVVQVDPDLVAKDDEDRPYSVCYEAVNAMLLNEFLNEHREGQKQARANQERQATIRELKSTPAQQQNEITALSTGLDRVSNQLKLANAAHVATSNP